MYPWCRSGVFFDRIIYSYRIRLWLNTLRTSMKILFLSFTQKDLKCKATVFSLKLLKKIQKVVESRTWTRPSFSLAARMWPSSSLIGWFSHVTRLASFSLADIVLRRDQAVLSLAELVLWWNHASVSMAVSVWWWDHASTVCTIIDFFRLVMKSCFYYYWLLKSHEVLVSIVLAILSKIYCEVFPTTKENSKSCGIIFKHYSRKVTR